MSSILASWLAKGGFSELGLTLLRLGTGACHSCRLRSLRGPPPFVLLPESRLSRTGGPCGGLSGPRWDLCMQAQLLVLVAKQQHLVTKASEELCGLGLTLREPVFKRFHSGSLAAKCRDSLAKLVLELLHLLLFGRVRAKAVTLRPEPGAFRLGAINFSLWPGSTVSLWPGFIVSLWPGSTVSLWPSCSHAAFGLSQIMRSRAVGIEQLSCISIIFFFSFFRSSHWTGWFAGLAHCFSSCRQVDIN
mmetsp:Transcript_23847/g.76076  ORF Transcript_23847/g.76076 Transcript_23847/m.76076 type:complete len:246 (-) Transcript_23847:273-1010(-)